MKFARNLVLAAAALVAALCFAPQAFAASQMLCAPESAGTAPGPRIIVNPNTNKQYSLNSAGCAVVASGDIGYMLSQGFTPGPSQNSIIYTTGALPASGTGDIVIGAVPAGAYIQQIIIQNTTANAVTGGVSIGTTANGTDIVAAQAVGANALVFVTDATLLKRVFSTTAATPLHAAPVTSSNTANLTFTVVYGYF